MPSHGLQAAAVSCRLLVVQVVVTQSDGRTSTSEERRVAVFDPAAPQHSGAGIIGGGSGKKEIVGSKRKDATGVLLCAFHCFASSRF